MALKNTKRNEGFTIIEVLIVLAIAGLIMLVVFLAVPALQRNSRNTQRRDEVGRIASSAQEVISNNNGALTGLTDANLRAAAGTLGYYSTATNITVASGVAAITNDTTTDTVVVYKNAKCAPFVAPATGVGATSSGANGRQYAVVYSVETGSGSAKTCLDS